MAAITEDVLEAERAAYAERMERERIGDWGVILKRAGFRRKIKDADGNEHEELSLDIVDQGDIHDDSLGTTIGVWRSEERRVGQGRRSRGGPRPARTEE